jgi:hypothetical protein
MIFLFFGVRHIKGYAVYTEQDGADGCHHQPKQHDRQHNHKDIRDEKTAFYGHRGSFPLLIIGFFTYPQGRADTDLFVMQYYLFLL